MRNKILLALVALLSLGAFGAAAGVVNNGVPKASLNGAKHALTKKGSLVNGAVGHSNLKNSIVSCQKLTYDLQNVVCRGVVNGKDGAPGVAGVRGPAGPVGPAGAQGVAGAPGDSYLKGAYYAVAYVVVGDTNAGAIATVACADPSDVAISGGVQVLGLDEGANSRNTPVSSSFPGRMDWSTNTPKPGRLDGWIIQFGGNAGTVSDKDPLKEKVYALCVPGLDLPVVTTYTQSS